MPASKQSAQVAVFGSSAAGPDSPEYRTAFEVGRLLALAGLGVINGGYGGVMEASARGAREAGGSATGVTVQAFRQRGRANRFIDTEFDEADLFDRTRRLIDSAAAFIILPGKSGTLAELTFLWALRRADLLGGRPIVLLGEVWSELLRELARLRVLEAPEIAATRVTSSPTEAVDTVLLSIRETR